MLMMKKRRLEEPSSLLARTAVLVRSHRRSDLLTANYNRVYEPLCTRSRTLVSNWCWQETASDGFLAAVQKAERYQAREHAQRFSRRYAHHLPTYGIYTCPHRATAQCGSPLAPGPAHDGLEGFLDRCLPTWAFRYLDRLHQLSCGSTHLPPIAAWSEMGAPTLCLHQGFTMGTLNPAHLGDTYSFDGRVTREEWVELLKQRGRAPGKLYHALKW